MAHLVYKLTNTANGKSYIGITARTLDERWAEHVGRARQGVRNSRLASAMRKYGNDVFTREVIDTAESENELRALEQKHIRELDTFRNGYNANEGGCGWLEVPADVRLKMSESQRGKIISAKAREKMSAAKMFKPECAINFGAHGKSGSDNPRAGWFAMSCPDGILRIERGLRAFARNHSIHYAHLRGRGHSKGYVLLDRFNQLLTACT